MRRVLVGGIAAGLAGASLMAWSLPASAQEGEEPPMLAATLEPATVATGGTVTVSSVDPCPEGDTVVLGIGPEGWYYEDEPTPLAVSAVPLAEDGSWTTAEPVPFPAGGYEVLGYCTDEVVEEEMEGPLEPLTDLGALTGGGDHPHPEEPPAEDPVYGFYGPLALTITGTPGTLPPGTPPPAPGPAPAPAPAPGTPAAPVARPVTGQPDYTG